MNFIAARLSGQCRNGFERDAGTITHAIDGTGLRIGQVGIIGYGVALCGRKPGRRSNGWSNIGCTAVDCPKCLKKIARAQVTT